MDESKLLISAVGKLTEIKSIQTFRKQNLTLTHLVLTDVKATFGVEKRTEKNLPSLDIMFQSVVDSQSKGQVVNYQARYERDPEEFHYKLADQILIDSQDNAYTSYNR